MHYLYAANNDWYEDFDGPLGYATFVDMRTNDTVLITHGDAYGHLPCIEQAGIVIHADLVVCCYPGAVRERYPHLNILGDWHPPTRVTCLYSPMYDVRFVELTSDEENTRYHNRGLT